MTTWCIHRSSARTGAGASLRSERDLRRLEPAGQAVGRGPGDIGEVVPLARELEDGGIGSGHRLQVVHHAGQPEHLVVQRPQLIRDSVR